MSVDKNLEMKVVLSTTQFKSLEAQGLLQEGVEYEFNDIINPNIYTGTDAPTSASACEKVGDIYIGVVSNVIRYWICDAIAGTTYTWRELLRDVTINGASATTNGVANIPIASESALGVVKVMAGYGVDKGGSGQLIINKATDAEVAAKSNTYKPLVPANLDKAIEEGLGAYNGTAFSDAKKTTACNTIGAAKKVVTNIYLEDA